MSDNQEQEYLEDGYVKISRKVFSSKTFSGLNAIQKLITIYLILMANHQDNNWWDKYHKQFIVIKRGSFVTSIDSIKKLLDDKLITTKKIRTTLELLKKMQFLAIETASGYSHITVLKYNLYQDGKSYKGKQKGKARARVGQGKGKGRAINNNGNNVNNDKNEKNKYMEVVFLTKKEYQKLIDMFGENIAKDKIEELNNSIMSKGYKYKSHYHTILCWDRKSKKGDQNGRNNQNNNKFKKPREDKYKHLEKEYKV